MLLPERGTAWKMDFTTFSNEEFNPKAWINTALETCPTSTSVDNYVSTLVIKLQLLSQEVNSNVADVCSAISVKLPRAGMELDRIEREVGTLTERLSCLEADLKEAENDAEKPIKHITLLDHVKVRMKECHDLLKEADNLRQNMTNVEKSISTLSDAMDSGEGSVSLPSDAGIADISKKISAMEESCTVLKGLEEFKDTNSSLLKVQNNFLKLIVPQLRQHLEGGSDAISEKRKLLEEIVSAFVSLGKRDLLLRTFTGVRMSSSLKKWRDDTPKDFSVWLSGFLSEVTEKLFVEGEFLSSLLGPGVNQTHLVLKEFFRSLQPSVEDKIAEVVTKDSQSGSLVLASIHKNMLAFSSKLMNKFGLATKVIQEEVEAIVTAPIDAITPLFQRMERQHLKHVVEKNLERPDPAAQQSIDPMFMIEKLVESVSLVTHEMQLSLERSAAIIGRTMDAVDIVDGAMQQYFEAVLSSLKCCGVVQAPSQGTDWSDFRHGMRILQLCGTLKEKLQDVEVHIRTKFLRAEDCAGKAMLQDSAKGLAAVRSISQEIVLKSLCGTVNKSTREILERGCWSTEKAARDSHLPSFSMSPCEPISTVGEHLLIIPEQFDTLTETDLQLLLISDALVAQEQSPADDDGSDDLDADASGSDGEGADDNIAVLTRLTSYWIRKVAEETASAIYDTVKAVPNFTKVGKQQLQVDLDYIGNVLTALGEPLPAILEDIRLILSMYEGKVDADLLKQLSKEQASELRSKFISDVSSKPSS